eukprot:gene6813-4893_t
MQICEYKFLSWLKVSKTRVYKNRIHSHVHCKVKNNNNNNNKETRRERKVCISGCFSSRSNRCCVYKESGYATRCGTFFSVLFLYYHDPKNQKPENLEPTKSSIKTDNNNNNNNKNKTKQNKTTTKKNNRNIDLSLTGSRYCDRDERGERESERGYQATRLNDNDTANKQKQTNSCEDTFKSQSALWMQIEYAPRR